MASLSDMLAANNAAVQATKEFEQLLVADFELLFATEGLLCMVRDMKLTRVLRSSVNARILKYKDELHCLMVKYGVELVPSETYVDAFDLRVIGTETKLGVPVRMAPLMTDMDADPESVANMCVNAVDQHFGSIAKQAPQAPQAPQACCIQTGAWKADSRP